jgi:raffinose/stachyose/melibiose transport system permease protein
MLSRTERVVCLVILAVAAIVTLYPMIVLISTGLSGANSSSGGITFFSRLSLSAFRYAWVNGDFSRYMLNTVIVTVSVVVVSAVIAIMAGYSIALARPPGARWVLYASVFGFMLPVEALIVPWYYQFRTVGIVNTYWSMILPQVAQ